MIKKRILLISSLLSFNTTAIEQNPTQTYTIQSNQVEFNNSSEYIKIHRSKSSAENEIFKYYKEKYGVSNEKINQKTDINSNSNIKIYSSKNAINKNKIQLTLDQNLNLDYDNLYFNNEKVIIGKYKDLNCENESEVEIQIDNFFGNGQLVELGAILKIPSDFSNYDPSNPNFSISNIILKVDENGFLYGKENISSNKRIYFGEDKGSVENNLLAEACYLDEDILEDINLITDVEISEIIKLESEKDDLTQSCAMVGNPCDVGTGNKFQEEIDYTDSYISFNRYYNSENTEYYDTTGFIGWTHTFSNRIYSQNLRNDLEEIVINNEKGKKNYYKKYSNDTYIGTTNINTSLKIVFQENELYEHVGERINVFDIDTGLLKRVILEDIIYSMDYSHYKKSEEPEAAKLLTNVNSNRGSGYRISFIYRKDHDSGKYHLDKASFNGSYILYKKSNNFSTLNENNQWVLNISENLFKVEYYSSSKESQKIYHYEDPNYNNLLTGITDRNGIRYATWTYDENGWVNSSTHANGYERIDISNDRSQVSNSKGAITQYYFDKVAGKNILKNIINADNINYDTGEYDRESPYAKTNIENNNSTTTKNEYNSLNQLIRTYTIDNQSNILNDVEYEYIERTELGGGFNISKIITPNLEIQYQYENREDRNSYYNKAYSNMNYGIPTRELYERKPKKIIYTDVTSQNLPYQTNNRAREINFLYYHSGQDLRAIDGFRTDVNDIIYYDTYSAGVLEYIYSSECLNVYDFEEGRVSVKSNFATLESCRYIKFENFYRNTNLPQRIIDENNLITEIVYDYKKRIESSILKTTNGDIITSYIYDKEDQVKQINLPNGSWLKYTYNEARYLEKIENSLGESIEFDTDTEGMLIERRIKSSTGIIVQQQNWVYSNSNRLLKTISGNLFEEFYGYDSIGNISYITDNLNNVNQLNYDGLNRVSKEIDALNGEVTKTYDTASRINTVTDQRGNKTTYTLDGFGNVIRIDSPDTGITDMWYDEADNMTKKVLADGTEINYVYDVSNRLTDIIYPDTTLNVHFDYDTATYGKGKIALITYKHGSISYTYNELGLVDTQTNIINNEIYVTSYKYTNWGTLNGITYPSGRQVDYILDSIDRVTGISVDGRILISNVEYLPFGSFKSFDYGNGISFSGTFDKDYLVRNVTHTNAGNDIFNETYGYEKMYQINTITDNLDSNKNQSFTYDAKSQLINAIGNYGDYQYTLDPVGNRLSKTVNMIETETYNVDLLSNRLLSIDKGSETRTLNYDAKGNVIEDIGYDSISKTLTYGDNNRLVDVDGYIYGYNPMNQRVIDNGKINNYDLNGQLISVNDGNLIIEYIYLGNMKIAMLQDNGVDLNIYYAHNNYMGMPRLFTDENKNIVWSGDFTPFGELFNENGSVSNLIRFTGQYENIETGYFYNYHRDYDASLGRYLQSDPIGLNGGINTYAYVAGNPINFVDPLGLKIHVSPDIQEGVDELIRISPIHKKIFDYIDKNETAVYWIGSPEALRSLIGKNKKNNSIIKDSLENPFNFITPKTGEKVGIINCGNLKDMIDIELLISHELMHIYDHFTGNKNKDLYYSEKRAVMLENIYRKKANGKKRKTYDGIDNLFIEKDDVDFYKDVIMKFQ